MSEHGLHPFVRLEACVKLCQLGFMDPLLSAF